MSFGESIYLNSNVPIEFFFPDGSSTKYVRAKVFSPDQTELASFNLTNHANGKYSHAGYFMPNEIFITVCFFVFDDSEYSIPSGVGGDIDLFYKLTPDNRKTSAELIGYVEDDSIELIGFVESDDKEILVLVEN